MSYYEKLTNGVQAICRGIEEGQSIMSSLGGSPTERIKELIDGLFSFAKFKEGDLVRLSKTPQITEEDSWGWMGSKHFLIKGAKATVRSVDWDARHKVFIYGLVFNKESWINSLTNKKHPVKQKHTFCFAEHYMEKR